MSTPYYTDDAVITRLSDATANTADVWLHSDAGHVSGSIQLVWHHDGDTWDWGDVEADLLTPQRFYRWESGQFDTAAQWIKDVAVRYGPDGGPT